MSASIVESTYPVDDIIFKDVPDQYVQGESITVVFSATNDVKIDPENDSVGLIRIGSTNIKECLAYGKIEIEESGSFAKGKATFSSSDLPSCDEEFYQFCYIQNQRKSRGTSVPFQLNCSPDDIDLLSSTISSNFIDRSGRNQSQNTGLYEFSDGDNEDLVVIQTKRMLTEEKLRQESRHLFDVNQKLAKENEFYKIKFDEYIKKVQQEMEILKFSHKTAINELAGRQQLETKVRNEYENVVKLCEQYRKDALDSAERYQELEESHTELQIEARRLENQLSLAVEHVQEQTSKLEKIEGELEQTKNNLLLAGELRLQAEQKLNDLYLTSEKFQKSAQSQIETLKKQLAQQENQTHALQTANFLLKEELKSVRDENILLTQQIQKEQSLNHQYQQDRSEKEKLRENLEKSQLQQEEYRVLSSSVAEIKNRCIKHQRGEIEVKKQLVACKEHVQELQDKIQELRERLTVGSDEYRILYRKFHAAEQMLNQFRTPVQQQNPTSLSNETGLNEEALVSMLQNSYQIQQREQLNIQQEEKKQETRPVPTENVEIRECPMCYWEFPAHMTLDNKKDHIEAHFD